MKRRFFFLIMGVAVLMVATAAVVTASGFNLHTTQLVTLPDREPIPGARAFLYTNDEQIRMLINTRQLAPGDAVTIWWAVFSNPDECSNGTPGFTKCGPPDMANPAVQGDVLFADGTVIEQNGRGQFAATLYQGEVLRGWFGNGLVNPTGAEVHLVVRTHAQAIPVRINDMVQTFGGACSNIPEGHPVHNEVLPGTPGPNECADIQLAVFQQ